MDRIDTRIIGYVSSPVTHRTDEQWSKVESQVVLLPEYRQGLRGLAMFSHALIVTWLHEARFDPVRHLVRRPQGRADMPEIGIFSQRAKDRPNPIGITAASIVGMEPDALVVRGLDAIDGTPVIDIKPYYPAFDRKDDATVPEWVDRLMKDYF